MEARKGAMDARAAVTHGEGFLREWPDVHDKPEDFGPTINQPFVQQHSAGMWVWGFLPKTVVWSWGKLSLVSLAPILTEPAYDESDLQT